MRWCLVPAFPRSTGLGPVRRPFFAPGSPTHPRPLVRGQADRLDSAQPKATAKRYPKHRSPAMQPDAASRLFLTRGRVPTGGRAMVIHAARQTKSLRRSGDYRREDARPWETAWRSADVALCAARERRKAEVGTCKDHCDSFKTYNC